MNDHYLVDCLNPESFPGTLTLEQVGRNQQHACRQPAWQDAQIAASREQGPAREVKRSLGKVTGELSTLLKSALPGSPASRLSRCGDSVLSS